MRTRRGREDRQVTFRDGTFPRSSAIYPSRTKETSIRDVIGLLLIWRFHLVSCPRPLTPQGTQRPLDSSARSTHSADRAHIVGRYYQKVGSRSFVAFLIALSIALPYESIGPTKTPGSRPSLSCSSMFRHSSITSSYTPRYTHIYVPTPERSGDPEALYTRIAVPVA